MNVAVFENLSDGQALEKFLMGRRIEARINDDRALRHFLLLRPPRVTYRVQVRGNAFRAATELATGAREAAPILERALHCPSCGSLRVNYPQMTRKFIMPTVILHLEILFRVIDHECCCESCHFVWNLPKENAAVHEIQPVKPLPF